MARAVPYRHTISKERFHTDYFLSNALPFELHQNSTTLL